MAAPQGTTYGHHNVHTYATTEVEVDEFSYVWTLKNYSSQIDQPYIFSPTFIGGKITKHHWQIRISPKKSVHNLEFFGVHLILRNFGSGDASSGRTVKARFKISLLNNNDLCGKQSGSNDMDPCVFKINGVWGYDKFTPSHDVTAPCRKLINDDQLKVLVNIWIEGDLKHDVCYGGAVKRGLDQEEKATRLAAASNLVRNNTEMKDFQVITTKGTIFVDKAVVAASSTVFEAMFQNDMKQKSTDQLEIKTFEDNVVCAMVEYLYTGTSAAITEHPTELLKIADTYGVAGLKEECEFIVAEKLTVENAAELLHLADTCHALNLLQRVMNFMIWNKDMVKETDGFKLVSTKHPAVFKNFFIF